MKFLVAVDVGGTSIKAALLNSDFEILDNASCLTPPQDLSGGETIFAISEIASTFAAHHKIDAVGLVVPGALDEVKGSSRWSGNLGWRDLPIRDLLSQKLQLPVAFGHDVRAGALAELRMGAAVGYANSIFIPIGTGIAAALVIDGAIRSSDGYAGEVGHLKVSNQRLCVCGKIGCLEAVASASAIARNYESASGEQGLAAEKVFELVQRQDPTALLIWNEALDALALACEMLVTILAPEAIIFGGGLSKAGDALTDPLLKRLRKSLTFQRLPELKIAKFSTQAGTIGSAIMALDLIKEGAHL